MDNLIYLEYVRQSQMEQLINDELCSGDTAQSIFNQNCGLDACNQNPIHC